MYAIGLTRDWGLGSLRITLGTGTNTEQIDSFLNTLPKLIVNARNLARN
jgi:cysteine sulfinate desulfinase/cysteine desulfurase-like protein